MDVIQLATLMGINEAGIISMMPEIKSNPTPMQYVRRLSEDTGYQMQTDYAERIIKAVEEGDLKHQYAEMLCEAEQDYKKLTELVMMLNWLGWYYDDVEMYNESAECLKWWEDADERGFKILKGEELDYFIRTLD